LPTRSEAHAIAVTSLDQEAFIQFCKDDNVASNNDCAERSLGGDGKTACFSSLTVDALL